MERAFLHYGEIGPEINIDSISSERLDVSEFEVDTEIILGEGSSSRKRVRKTKIGVLLDPIIRAERSYVVDENRPEPLYPPSSEGWLSRIEKGASEAILFVHKTTDDKILWLTIIDKDSFKIHEAHPISPFESEILELVDEYEEYLGLIKSLRSIDETYDWLETILNGPPPSWSELSRITDDVFIPHLRIRKNMRETMEQLVSEIYDYNARNQLMAFLALVTKWKIPTEDPVEYIEKLRPLNILLVLIQAHIKCKLSRGEVPSYVRIFQESVQHQLARPTRPLRDTYQIDPLGLAFHKISERMSKVPQTSIKFAKDFNDSKQLIVQLPVTMEQSAKSQEAWGNRFSLMQEGLRLQTVLRPQALGLVRLIDLTRAHQWPHKHMKWSASISGFSHKEPHIQIMEMPPSAVEKVLRFRPNVIVEEWSASTVNARLFNHNNGMWKTSFARISNALGGNQTVRKLKNEFGSWKGVTPYVPRQDWTRCLDITSNLGFLASLEQVDYLEQFCLTSDKLYTILSDLQEKTIIDIIYAPVFRELMTVAVIAHGPPSRICSLSRGFLKHSPSATTSIGKKAEWLLVLARLPLQTANSVIGTLPQIANQHDVTLSCHRVVSWRSYLWKFYQRILKEDGLWDDDVSAMLSQIRLPLPEENHQE
jgi:hypothetical protein